jgi:hypothetical protein
LIGVFGARGRLVRTTKADEVGRDGAESRTRDDGDHLAIQERPRWLAVQEQNRFAVRWSRVDVMHAKRRFIRRKDLDINGFVLIAGKVLETRVGCPEHIHGRQTSEF